MRHGSRSVLPAIDVETVFADIRDADAVSKACRGVDTVFHTAAISGIWGTWNDYYQTNVRGTDHVIAACRRHRVSRLVYTSSPSVVFNGQDQRGVDESTPYADRWLCHYPHSKALAEQHVLAASGSDGLLTCSLRPHLIWGPRDRQLIPRLIERARSGRLIRVGNGSNWIDVSYVENVAEAHLLAAKALEPGSPVVGQAYFVSQGEPVQCWDWMSRILALAGLPTVHWSISLRAAYALGSVVEALWSALRLRCEPPMTRFLALELGHSHHYDIGRAKRDFGYAPRVSITEGLGRLAEDLKSIGVVR
jgi:nucleoside-diphosphate-sugar epimerase